ncbi:MAG TPA: alpha/beta hydrolase-fold protein [Polyangia bacterium]
MSGHDTGATRRGFLAGLGGAAALAACGGRRRGAPSPAAATGPTIRELRFDDGPGAPQRVVVLVPEGAAATARVPLLIALHGRGEAHRGLAAGAWGWVRDYRLDRTAAALRRPPLGAADLADVATRASLAAVNAALAARPYGGLVVACPFTPDVLADRDLDGAAPFGRFLVERLIPRLRRELPVIPTRAATGIDGVSLGGRVALLAGMAHADAFGAVGTLQAAFAGDEIAAVVAPARAMLQRAPAPPRLRLLTSDGDFFRGTLVELAAALTAAGWPAELKVVPGPHDYAFNRGPGGVEMLLWHDRVLRGG